MGEGHERGQNEEVIKVNREIINLTETHLASLRQELDRLETEQRGFGANHKAAIALIRRDIARCNQILEP